MGIDLSLPSIMGFVSLSGVVVNDSLLLVEFLKIRMTEGLSAGNTAPAASRQRFRAVLLTSRTTVMDIAPLLTERSFQAQILIPLVTGLVFGLPASTVPVQFVLPALYASLDGSGLTAEKRDPFAS